MACWTAVVAVCAPAAETSAPELVALRAGYDAELTRLEGILTAQKTNALAAYRRALEAQMAVQKGKGDLDGYLVLEAEKKRFAAEETVDTNQVTGIIGELVAQYQKLLQEKVKAYEKAKRGFLRTHVSRLAALVQSYTRQGQIENAKKANDDLQIAKTDLLFYETDAPSEPPKPDVPPARKPAPEETEPNATLLGTWECSWRNGKKSGTDRIMIKADGSAIVNGDKAAGGEWELKNGQCFIRWPQGDYTFALSTDGKRMLGHSKAGALATAVKVIVPLSSE